MRIFVGIKIDKGLEEKIGGVQKEFGGFSQSSEIKFVEPGNFHLTLKFLGEIEEGRSRDSTGSWPLPASSLRDLLPPAHNSVKEISERVKSACWKFKSFRISLDGLSFFNPPKSLRVIFLNIVKGKEMIIEIGKELNNLLRDFREEDFKPHPHLTIARVGFTEEKDKIIEKIKSIDKIHVGEMDVKEIILFESALSSRGPIYTELERFPLLA